MVKYRGPLQKQKMNIYRKIIVSKHVLAYLCATVILAVPVAAYALHAPEAESVTYTAPEGNISVVASTTKPDTQKAEQNSSSQEKSESVKKETAKLATPKATPAAPTTRVNAAPAQQTPAPISPRGKALYVDPTLARQGRPAAIATQPIASWFGGWNADIKTDVNAVVSAASSQGKLAALIAYNIPKRDCGSYSAGGAANSQAYREWIRLFAAGVGQREAIVIIEPDALPGLDCLSNSDQQQRLQDISYAVSTLTQTTKASVYIDAGNYSWQSASTMAERLRSAGVSGARGFSINVSGFGWQQNTVAYGDQLARLLGGKSYVIDTSRNGQGPTATNEWCNPRGRGLGKLPTTSTGLQYVDAYLWAKVPGESDGECNGGPGAGTWWQDYAQELIDNARH